MIHMVQMLGSVMRDTRVFLRLGINTSLTYAQLSCMMLHDGLRLRASQNKGASQRPIMFAKWISVCLSCMQIQSVQAETV